MTDLNAPTSALDARPAAGRWHDLYPELGTGPLDTAGLTSPEQFEREREHISHHVVARMTQVSEAGVPA